MRVNPNGAKEIGISREGKIELELKFQESSMLRRF
jgi:hypothetical protein